MTESDFLAQRRLGIGGSDVASVLNLEPWGCARRLFYEKTGVEADYRLSGPQLQRGKDMEPLIAAMFARITGFRVEKQDAVPHPKLAFLRVNADLLVEDHEGNIGVAEIKDQDARVFAKSKREGIHLGYALQLQHGMIVWGLKFGYMVVHCVENWGNPIIWRVEEDLELQKMMVDACAEFWRRVVEDDIPDRLNARDHRCKTCTHRLVCDRDEDEYVVGAQRDESMAELMQQAVEANALAKQAADYYEDVKTLLAERLGERTAVESSGGRVYFKPQKRTTPYDSDAVKEVKDRVRELMVELFNQAKNDEFLASIYEPLATELGKIYTPKVSQSRPLRIYPPRRKK
jgi:predicted phage-related endonuclease